MYSKTLSAAIIAVVLCTSCGITLPWANEPVGEEVNVAFVIRNNLLFLPSVTVDGKAGQFILGTANARTAIDSKLAANLPPASGRQTRLLQLNSKEALRFTPTVIDMQGVADGIIGADVWGDRAISIDYSSRLLIYQKEGIHPELMTIYRFDGEPRVRIEVDGKEIDAVVDTASPDTLTLPRGNTPPSRTHAHVRLAGNDFGTIDIKLADVSAPRVGNRILSKFLVTIDYGKKEVGLWRDPRTL
jgi:hypothetical protein